MLTFLAAIFLLVITPGPGVLTTAGIGSAFGYRAGLSFVAGLFVGSNLVAIAVVTGLAAIIFSVPIVRIVLTLASAGYLLYIAATIAFAGSKVAFIERADPPGFKGALMLQAINPKAYVVATVIFSGFPLFPDQFLGEVIFKFIALNVIWIPVHFLWLWAGVSLRRLDLPANVQRGINVVMALAMVAVVVLAAWQSF